MTVKSRKFQKRVEDFICEKCGNKVKGSGFTNHCPKCLWSKHVDINPGDREETCGGLMVPESAYKDGDGMVIEHLCQKCGYRRKNKLNKDDDFDAFLNISKNREV